MMKSVNIGGYTVYSNGDILSNKIRKVLLKGWLTKTGYNYIKINNVSKARHSIIAYCFLGKKEKGYSVNHIDGDKLNNDISNLEYITMKENYNHALKNGLKRNIFNFLTIDECSDMVEYYCNTNNSMRRVADLVGFDKGVINRLMNGKFTIIV